MITVTKAKDILRKYGINDGRPFEVDDVNATEDGMGVQVDYSWGQRGAIHTDSIVIPFSVLDATDLDGAIAEHREIMKREKEIERMGWLPFGSCAAPDPQQGFFLVTNNVNARDAHGHMSHVWITSMVHGPDKDGFFSAFAHPSDQKIEQIKFWKPLYL